MFDDRDVPSPTAANKPQILPRCWRAYFSGRFSNLQVNEYVWHIEIDLALKSLEKIPKYTANISTHQITYKRPRLQKRKKIKRNVTSTRLDSR